MNREGEKVRERRERERERERENYVQAAALSIALELQALFVLSYFQVYAQLLCWVGGNNDIILTLDRFV